MVRRRAVALLLAIVSVWAVGAGDAFVTNPTRGGADGTSSADRFAELSNIAAQR
jgi:hypothetical protein